MATSYKTPGVYINEVTTLPSSIAQVATAIPAFIGYTEFAQDLDGSSLTDVPVRIASMVEYTQYFGGSSIAQESSSGITNSQPKVILDGANGYSVDSVSVGLKFVLFQSLSMYFANGGGACYIVSVGGYKYTLAEATRQADLISGLSKLETEDEPTILLAPDAALMTSPILLGGLQKNMLIQCNKLQDRFAIMDLIEDASTNDLGETDFRTQVGMQYLKYGAAYGPHLETNMRFVLQYKDLVIEDGIGDVKESGLFNTAVEEAIGIALDDLALIEGLITEDFLDEFDDAGPSTNDSSLQDQADVLKEFALFTRDLVNNIGNEDILRRVVELVDKNSNLAAIVQKARAYDLDNTLSFGSLGIFDATDFTGFDITSLPFGLDESDFDYDLGSVVADPGNIYVGVNSAAQALNASFYFRDLLIEALPILTDLKNEAKRVLALLEEALVSVDPIYAGIKQAIAAKGIVLPPSGSVAGAYVSTDAERGVWKAPANVSLVDVVKPTIKVDNASQERLNVDTTSGKSINVIRSFTGKGVLIWGARTLAGNDNEWRYVPVRRLFNTVEESVKKATEFVVFEPNDGNTWLRTKTIVQNYLTGLWRQGALAGAKPEDAFFVNVGLGTTMTVEDILEGKMIVEIGLAAARPAEFIILRFSRKLEQS